MDWQTHKQQLLKKPGFRNALKETELEFHIAEAMIAARTKRGISQKQLADRLNTTQSVVSRVENAKTTPSLSFLKRLAVALDVTLKVELV